ncbi:MAG: cupin domain-containing protein [Alphaproteobacteria bacterium]|nr:cupin domain-containing protein [Alphaproteobacteria bacterium]MBM3654896.1 cupin domain-containing protein [Alphaproteobacteria bacterium]
MEQNMTRLAVAAIICLRFIASGVAFAEERAPAEVVTEIARTTKTAAGQPITLPQGPLEVVASIYTLAPGARLPEHKHPFQRYAYVLEGALMVQQADSSSRIYRPGEFIIESVDRWHYGATVGDAVVKLLVIDQLPPTAEATVERPPAP